MLKSAWYVRIFAAFVTVLGTFGSGASVLAQVQTEMAKIAGNAVSLRPYWGSGASSSGNTLVVGAFEGALDGVQVFEKSNSESWTKSQFLSAPSGAQGSGLGPVISGNTIFAASPFRTITTNKTGVVFIYERGTDGVWTLTQQLVEDDPPDDSRFGISVVLEDTRAFVVSQSGAGPRGGVLYAYTRNGAGLWTLDQVIPSNSTSTAFGTSLAVSGSTLIVGAQDEDVDGIRSGAAYVFVRDPGQPWALSQRITSTNPSSTFKFGSTVAMSEDTLLIGGFTIYNESGLGEYSLHSFSKDPNGVWVERQVFGTASTFPTNIAGFTTGLNLVGDRAFFGKFDSNSFVGSIAVFQRDEFDLWSKQMEFLASDGFPDPRGGNQGFALGRTIAIDRDYLLANTQGLADRTTTTVGEAVYVFALTPAINSPQSGSALTGGTQSITWQPGLSDVTEYWLYAGATIDSAGYFNSGSLAPTVTSTVVTGLPTNGSPVFMRLWYRVSGDTTWYYKDFGYNANGNAPSITAPAASTQLTGPVATLTWQPGASLADEYWVYAGSTVGGAEYANSGSLGQQLTGTVTGLPLDGASPVYVRLWYRNGSTWYAVDAQYVAAAGTAPTITTPAPASVLPGSTATFNWSSGGNPVTQWWLYVGSTPQGREYFDSGSQDASTTQLTVTGLPENGTPVYATLWYRYGSTGYWLSAPSTYTAANTSAVQMTSPGPGTALNGSSAAFAWTDNGSGVEEWWVYAGSTPGGTQYLDSGSLSTATTVTVTGLPADRSNVYITLWYRQGALWMFESYAYPSNP